VETSVAGIAVEAEVEMIDSFTQRVIFSADLNGPIHKYDPV